MSRTIERPFREIAFIGGRFHEGGVSPDLNVLNELRVYRKVVVETAKELWRWENPARQLDPPPEFEAGFRLGVSGSIGDGCSRVSIARIWDADSDRALSPSPNETDLFDEAADRIDRTLVSLRDGRHSFDDMPISELGELAKLGRTLAPGESVVVAKPGERGETMDSEIRQRLKGKVLTPTIKEEWLKGKVRAMELRSVREGGSFKIKLDYGYTVPGAFTAEQEPVIAEALRSRHTVRLKLRGLCESPPTRGKFRRIVEVYDCEITQDADEPVYDSRSVLRIFDEIHKSAPESAWDHMPTDGARNYKHYLYGHPKEEEEEE